MTIKIDFLKKIREPLLKEGDLVKINSNPAYYNSRDLRGMTGVITEVFRGKGIEYRVSLSWNKIPCQLLFMEKELEPID